MPSSSKIPLKKTFSEQGHSSSPVLEDGLRNIILDIDGTICDDIPNENPQRMHEILPYPEALKMVNTWYERGHIITFFSSRSEELRELTTNWLAKHGFNYHNLILGKPRGGKYHWIDNQLLSATRFKIRFVDLDVDEFEIDIPVDK